MDDDRDRDRRRGWRIARWAAASAFLLALRLVPLRWLEGHPLLGSAAAVLFAVLLGAMIFAAVAAIRRSRREAREIRDARKVGRWPLGMRYVVEADHALDGSRRPSELNVGETEIRIATIETDSPLFPDVRRRMPLADVVAIRVRSSWIEIAAADQRVRVVPRSYEDRQRLLFELAVRCNDAVERGIDEDAAAARAAPPATAHAPRFREGLDPTGLDRAATGLGSALAGPDAPLNPAPPRRSGLGVGLFPGTPES